MTGTRLSMIDEGDEVLLARAASYSALRALGDCTCVAMAKLAREQGVDFATAVLYDRLTRDEVQREFMQRLEQLDKPLAEPSFRVVIVPGAFYRRYPHTGGDGRIACEALRELGYDVSVFSLPEFQSLEANAELLADWMQTECVQPTVFVSLSKGGLDLALALRKVTAKNALPLELIAWINLSGLLEGTALIPWLKQRRWRWLGLRWLLWAKGYSRETLAELERAPLEQFPVLERHTAGELLTIHVAGFPRQRHLSDRWATRGHQRLADFGPNDGGGILLADIAARTGYIYPVWGADHYLRPTWDIRRLISRLINFIEEERPCRTQCHR